MLPRRVPLRKIKMETEIEAKFTDIDPKILRSKLKDLGAHLEQPEILMRRKVFDDPDRRLKKIGGWIRVRDENNKITLSYKQLNDRTLHGTKEITVDVDNFDKTCEFLETIGFVVKSFQETKREKWIYKKVEVTIDTWPWIPTFTELEGSSEELLKEVAADLNLPWATALHGSVETVYQQHYNFTEEEIDHWPEITFIPEPAWLLAKKK